MKNLTLAALMLGATSTGLYAGSFSEMSERLDLDGDFVGFVDFDGEGQQIGEKLNVLYQQFAEVNPQVPPFPLDFPSLFDALGFGSIRAMGMSSTEVEEGLHRNRSVTLLDGDPAGLFGIYSLEPIGFRAAEFAPADATTVFSGRLDFDAIVTTAQTIASQVMGPMGEGMVMQGLSQPVPGTDVTIGEAVSALSGGMDFVMNQSFENPMAPDLNMWVSFKGASSLLPRLEPLFTQMGIQFTDAEGGRFADLSMLMQDAPFGLFVEAPSDSDELILYTDKAWADGFGSGEGLSNTPEFQRVVGRLPKDAAFYAYSKGVDLSQIMMLVQSKPEAAPFAPLIENAIDMLVGGFLEPNASATFKDGDALVTESYAGFSYKDAVMVLPAGIGAAVGAGIAADQFGNKGGSQYEGATESGDWESED